MEIDIDQPHISDNRVEFQLHVSKPLKKYFLETISYVQYDNNLDLRNANPSILIIPMLAMIAPISWATGADVRVNELDTAYAKSLAEIKEIYRKFYPHFSFSGNIQAEKLVTNQYCGDRTGMLFSGGVDSLTSYLRHRHKKPDLISIWGLLDLPHFEEKFWARMWADIRSLANREAVTAFQIRTDMIRNINHELLSKEFGLRWFGEVAHGPYVLGLCAPVTVSRRIGKVIIAASYTADYKVELGFYPPVDNSVSWADVEVFHDGYELSRQKKLKYLCQEENLGYLSNLRVCWDSAWKTNCGKCEKCFRTITGLAVEGIDPDDCNFIVGTETFSYIQDCFRKGRIALNEGQKFMWKDIQAHIPEGIDKDINTSKEFLTWLRKYDISKYKVNRLRRFLWDSHRLFCNKRMNTPSIKRKIKCYYYIFLSNSRKRLKI